MKWNFECCAGTNDYLHDRIGRRSKQFLSRQRTGVASTFNRASQFNRIVEMRRLFLQRRDGRHVHYSPAFNSMAPFH
jgi:hypothetical protein